MSSALPCNSEEAAAEGSATAALKRRSAQGDEAPASRQNWGALGAEATRSDMEVSEKEASRAKFRLTQKRNRGRGRGGAPFGRGGAAGAGGGRRGGSSLRSRGAPADLGSNADRFVASCRLLCPSWVIH